MAIVLLVLQALEAFTKPGLDQALIQRQGKIEALFPSVFTVNVLRGIGLGAIILAGGPFVADFFNQPDSAIVIQAAAIVVILRGLQSPAVALVHRELRYRTHYYWDLTNTIAGLLTAATLLALTHSVWVLLLAQIAEEAVRTLGSYVISSWHPKLQLVWTDVAELSRFGRWVVVGTIVGFFSLQLDSIVVGRMMDAESLGFYQVAMRVSQLPATLVSQVAATVAFPTLSRLSGQRERFGSAYLRMFSALALVNLVVSGTMVIFAEPIVSLALGSQWVAAVPALRILAAAGFIRSLVTVGGKVFYAAGRPKYDFIMNSVRLAVFSSLIVPLVRGYGIEGASLAVFGSIGGVLPTYLYLIQRSVGISPRDHVAALASRARTSLVPFRSIEHGAK